MKKLTFILACLLCTLISKSQTKLDTIYSTQGNIACEVSEIDLQSVKYHLPEETVIYSLPKNIIQQIVFKNGRVQTFTETKKYKEITTLDNIDDVYISNLPTDIIGLHKLTELYTQAKGTTMLSSKANVKDRAYDKLKTQCIMAGGNVVYLVNQTTERALFGQNVNNSTETSIQAIAYSNNLPDYNKFLQLIGNHRSFKSFKFHKLALHGSEVVSNEKSAKLGIDSLYNDEGKIMLNGIYNGDEFEKASIIRFTDSTFTLFIKRNNTFINVDFNINDFIAKDKKRASEMEDPRIN